MAEPTHKIKYKTIRIYRSDWQDLKLLSIDVETPMVWLLTEAMPLLYHKYSERIDNG
jgi:hypothetical protein